MTAPNIGSCEELKFEVTEVSHEWRIEDFSTNRPFMKDMVNSQTFPRTGVPQWFLQLYQSDSDTRRNGTFSFFLHLKKAENGEKSIVADYNLQFLNDDGTEIGRKNRPAKNINEGYWAGCVLMNGYNDPTPLSTLGHLIVRVTVRIRKPVRSVDFRSAIEIPKSSAHRDLAKLLKTGEYSDFAIESADGQVFPVHKNVLSTRNPLFFGVMFTSATKEAIEGRVKLPYEGKIVASLLDYLYMDEVAKLTPTAAQLYMVAHQYRLDRLVAICAANLSGNLTVANISVAMRIAKLFGDDKLLSSCQKFIDEHKDAAVQMVSDAAFDDDLDPKSDGSWLCCLGRIRKWF